MTLFVAFVAFVLGGVIGVITMAVISYDKERWDD